MMVSTLPVVEKFHSLQGEGAHTGRSAFFIRLALCNVQCPWCDTKNSWSENIYPKESLTELSKNVVEAQSQGAAFVVITGGEPLHHDLAPLCKAIRLHTLNKENNSIPIHIETSGVNELSGQPDWVTLSPKKHALPKDEVLGLCDELKIVIHDENDLIFAEEMARKTKDHLSRRSSPLLFLQAGWNNTEGQQLAFDYVKNNPTWRLSMQTHKWLGIL